MHACLAISMLIDTVVIGVASNHTRGYDRGSWVPTRKSSSLELAMGSRQGLDGRDTHRDNAVEAQPGSLERGRPRLAPRLCAPRLLFESTRVTAFEVGQ